MEINIPTGQDILRDTAIQYVNKAFVYITDCNPPLTNVFTSTLFERCWNNVDPICIFNFFST